MTALARLERSPLLLGALLVLTVLQNAFRLTAAPFWDAAMSVFPAALFLESHGFDYPALVHSPGFLEGGPNVHSTSLITLLTALAYAVFPSSPAALVALHLVHCGFTALAVFAIFHLARPVLGAGLALGLAAVCMIAPLFAVQGSAMYLEMPLLLACTWACGLWAKDRLVACALALALAAAIKETAAVALAAILVDVIAGFWRDPRELVRRACVVIPGALVAAARITLEHAAEGLPSVSAASYFSAMASYARSVPDVAALLLVGLVASMVLLVRELRDPACPRELRIAAALVVGWFAFYAGLVPLRGVFVVVIPRYALLALPAAIFVVVHALASWRAAAAGAALIALGVFGLVNADGALYPPAHNPHDGGEAERSWEYLDLQDVHAQVMALEARHGDGITVLHPLPEHYFSHFPAMGYVDHVPAQVHAIHLEDPYARLDPAQLPPELMVVLDQGAWGGMEAAELLRRMQRDGWQLRANQVTSGTRTMAVVEAHRAR